MKTERKLEIAERLPTLIRTKFTSPGGVQFAWENTTQVPLARQGKPITAAEWARMDDKPPRQSINQIYTYTLSWEQNMGGGRGINMSFDTQEWETARLIWINLIKYAPIERVRGFKASYKKSARHKAIQFNPLEDGFPRPPIV